MPTPRMTRETLLEAVQAVAQHGSLKAASEALGVHRATLQKRTVWRDYSKG